MGPIGMRDIAFGEFPDANVDDPSCVLPAQDPVDVWMRGVALAGQGRYARAVADLRAVIAAGRGSDGPFLQSVARCALASHRRQAGDHRGALVDDGVAASHALSVPDPDRRRVALVDALAGLAADRLGIGDLAGSGRLLDRAETVGTESTGAESTGSTSWWLADRARLRTAWVRAEWHLYSGRGGEALVVARDALDTAADCPSARHRLKTALLVAACHAAVGDGDVAREQGAEVAAMARRRRQPPLEWAALGLLVDLAASPDERTAAMGRRTELTRELRLRSVGFNGGSRRPDPSRW